MEDKTRGRRRRKIIRGLLLLTAAACVTLLALKLWLAHRAGPEYFGRPQYLLPPETALMATWLDLGNFVERAGRLQALEKIKGEDDAMAWLLTTSAWRNIEREKDKARYKILTSILGDFVRKWFGKEFTFALLPPKRTGGLGAMILIARAELGFEENLAELIAHLYPELALETRLYRGTRIHRYNAEKTRRAFSYCRFGSTVVLSIRSAGWRPLERIIDNKLGADVDGNKLQSLADDPAFLESAPSRRISEGLSAHVHPQRLIETMRALPAKFSTEPSWHFWFDYCEEQLAHVRWGTIRLTLRDGLRLESFWKTDGGASDSDPPFEATFPGPIESLPAQTPLFLTADSPGLRATLLDIRDRMTRSEAYVEGLMRFETEFRKQLGAEFRGDFLERLDGNFGAALTGTTTHLLLPTPETIAWWRFDAPAHASNAETLLATRHPDGSFLTPDIPGPWNFRAAGSYLHLTQGDPLRATTSSLTDHPLLTDLWKPDHPKPAFCFFANFETAYGIVERLARLRSAAALWSAQTQEEVEQWETILSAMRHLHALRLTAASRPGGQGVDVNLLISVD